MCNCIYLSWYESSRLSKKKTCGRLPSIVLKSDTAGLDASAYPIGASNTFTCIFVAVLLFLAPLRDFDKCRGVFHS
jgi:hypothetical protein